MTPVKKIDPKDPKNCISLVYRIQNRLPIMKEITVDILYVGSKDFYSLWRLCDPKDSKERTHIKKKISPSAYRLEIYKYFS